MWTSSLTAGLARGVFTGKYDQISSLASAIIFFNNGTVADTALRADTILLFPARYCSHGFFLCPKPALSHRTSAAEIIDVALCGITNRVQEILRRYEPGTSLRKASAGVYPKFCSLTGSDKQHKNRLCLSIKKHLSSS